MHKGRGSLTVKCELSATHHEAFQLIHPGVIVIKDAFTLSKSERKNDVAF